jgi:hypothetical protein
VEETFGCVSGGRASGKFEWGTMGSRFWTAEVWGDVVWWRWWRGLGSWWVVVMLIEEDDTLEVKSGVWLKGSDINRQKKCMAYEGE